MGFGAYLRRAREERALTLDGLAARTKIKLRLLADLEDDDLTRWPEYLVYRHGYVRAIAEALELDRKLLLRRFDDAFPDYAPVAFDSVRRPVKSTTALAAVLCVIVALFLGDSVRRTTGSGAVAGADPKTTQAAQAVTPDPGIAGPAPTAASPAANGDEVDGAEIPAVEGEIRVVSNPPDAVVTVNGIGRGRTPARIRYLPPGSYTIRVVQFGYNARESRVTLSTDKPVRSVRVALRPRRLSASNSDSL